jgi:hypothetical protein
MAWRPPHGHGSGAQGLNVTATTTVAAGRVGRPDGAASSAVPPADNSTAIHAAGDPCMGTTGSLETSASRRPRWDLGHSFFFFISYVNYV